MWNANKTQTDIYDICQTIHITTGLNVTFLDENLASSLVFRREPLPRQFEESLLNQARAAAAVLKDRPSDACLFCTDPLQLRYLAGGYREADRFTGTVLIGPFLFDIPNEPFLNEIIARNRLPDSLARQLAADYRFLQILDFERYASIGRLMVNLLSHPFLVGEMVPIESGNRKPAKAKSASEDTDALQSKIELRYRHQRDLLACVEVGDKEGALRIFQLTRFNPSDRVPNNPLRAHKNISLSFNTMLRMAAERGKVGPAFLHEISDRYARLIERVNNISELESLLGTMLAEYCDLVRKASTRGTSPPVRKAINHILACYASPLSLEAVAEKVNLNPCHLSRQFRKETGLTLTDYINRKRIDEARVLIDQGNRSISDIASAVGFESQTYFTTVFKRVTGQTPTQYIKNPNAG